VPAAARGFGLTGPTELWRTVFPFAVLDESGYIVVDDDIMEAEDAIAAIECALHGQSTRGWV
jgi:hypothetical protein